MHPDTENSLRVRALKVNACAEPLGLDTPQPLFQWQLDTQKQNCYQSAYRLIVTDGDEHPVWDTGLVRSDRQVQIPYDGEPLRSMTRYHWRVMVWDQEELASLWSEPARFETGLLQSSDWKADWIGGNCDFDPLSGLQWIGCRTQPGQTVDFLCTFCLEKPLQQAVFDGTAFAGWELFCNGSLYRRMNTDWKQDATSPIRYADLTEFFTPGENTLLLRVNADAQGLAAAIGKLTLREEDGMERCLPTDANWRVQQAQAVSAAGILGQYGDAPWGRFRRRGPAPLLRKTFTVEAPVQRARLYVCALGYGVCTINGKAVTDAVLQTEYSQYHKSVYYRTFDVTGLLQRGQNCLGAELGRGYYSFHKDWIGNMIEQDEPKLLLQLELWLADGQHQTILSGADWKTTDGPTVDDNIWYGDKYDARLLPAGWTLAAFSDADWKPVRLMRAPGGVLRAAQLPSIRVTERLQPVSVTAPADNIRVYDFGKVTTGWAELFVHEKPGTRLKLTYGEKLLENGRVDMQTPCGVYQFWERAQTDIYVCRGGEERWSPRFSYKGYRYIEVEGVDHAITLTGLVFHNDVAQTGVFSCSNRLIDQIHGLITPTILNNFHSIPTDTPTYEKRGWTGDAQSICDTALVNLDAQSFFAKWLQDLADSQSADGAIPDTCPGPISCPPAPEWMCAIVMLPYQLYLHCGDEATLRTRYPNMKRYAEYELRRLQDGMSSNLYYGDWNSPAGSRPPEGSMFNATCFVYRILTLMAQIAGILNQPEDATRYHAAAQSIRQKLNTEYFDEAAMLYHTEISTGFRQTPTVLPLAFGIAPEDRRGAIAASLAANIHRHDHDHLSTGCMGLKYLAPALTQYGQAETAYAIVTQTDCPSWGYWLSKGATSLWETWDTDSRSYNHFYFGTIDDWFYQYLAGIRPLTAGYRTFCIRPYPCGDLTHVQAQVQTPYGEISVHWTKADGAFTLQVAVPANTTAQIVLPDGSCRTVGSGRYSYSVEETKFYT